MEIMLMSIVEGDVLPGHGVSRVQQEYPSC